MTTIVIKYGGNAIEDLSQLDNFSSAVAQLATPENRLVIVHGGGPQIAYWLDKAHIGSHFVDGQRYTDASALDVVEMALSAQVNKALVRALQRIGINAVGISGEDGQLLQATQNPRLGAVGNITRSNPALIHTLLEANYLPVISPLATTEDYAQALNINADFATAHIAGALQADSCLFMTNVDGLLDAEKHLITRSDKAHIEALIADGTINGGMIPKVSCALKALELGVHRVRIVNAKRPESLHQATAGTEIVSA